MGAEMFLFLLVGHFICVQAVTDEQDDLYSLDLPGVFNDILPFLSERDFDFTPYDTILSSWRTDDPGSQMFAEIPPIMNIPKVQVYCDESLLTLLVDNRFGGGTLKEDEVQLGDGCYSNMELPNQLVFAYSFDKCGTTRGMQNGLEVLSNSLHFHLRKPPSNLWLTPSTVHISCRARRSNSLAALAENGRGFHIKAMNPSWTGVAESNVYKRGQVVNLQVSATTGPDQQLFIQSCFVSASPEAQTRPRHAVIMNKGCAACLGSPHTLIQFMDSKSADVVNVALNTTYLISEMYIHCSVLISDREISSGSKSCNYNLNQSRWEELGGNVEVCSCCGSKCKGLSVKHFPDDAKAIISTGPLVIVDGQGESPEPSVSEPQETFSAAFSRSMQSDAAASEDTILSVSSKSSEIQGTVPPKGVVVVSQEPGSRLTLWLPGQVQNTVSNDLEALQQTSTQESDLTTPNKIRSEQDQIRRQNELPSEAPLWDPYVHTQLDGWDPHVHTQLDGWDPYVHTQLDGWAITPQQTRVKTAQVPENNWFRGSKMVTEAAQPVVSLVQPEMNINVPKHNPLNKMKDETDAVSHQGLNDAQPIVRSKLQFSKSTDGSHTLSYEEEVVKRDGSEAGRFGMDGIQGKQETRRKGLLSTFLHLLRSMDKAE